VIMLKCKYCGRERDIIKVSRFNWNKHIESCKIKYSTAKGEKTKCSTQSFRNFFITSNEKPGKF